uniref:Uncharacterized protein n=1 Tax=Anguilla anguilla TaxID=7936 RepID=A0A0E9VQC9_ANGAN
MCLCKNRSASTGHCLEEGECVQGTGWLV